MYVKYVESHEYLRVANNNEAFLSGNFELNREVKEHIELISARADTLKKCEAILGETMRVAQDGDYANNTAAFVTTDTKQVYTVEETLDDEEFALYATKHEKEHKDNGVMDLDLAGKLESHQWRAILSRLGVTDLDDTEVLEGFNDWRTQRKHGKHHRSGYNNKEVPLAQKLDSLVREHTGDSLFEVFNHSSLESFYERLQLLGTILHFKSQLRIAA